MSGKNRFLKVTVIVCSLRDSFNGLIIFFYRLLKLCLFSWILVYVTHRFHTVKEISLGIMQNPYKLSSLLKTIFVAVALVFSKELLITM